MEQTARDLNMMQLILASEDPLNHVVDHDLWTVGPVTLLSNHIILLIAAGLILILLMPKLVRTGTSTDEIEQHTPRGPRNAIEALCVMLREFVARPALGQYTDVF